MRGRVVMSLLVLSVVAGAAAAQELVTIRTNGGLGMGGRALGMGGALTAIADASEALYWNPAALATDSRFQAHLSFTGDTPNVTSVAQIFEIYNALQDETLDLDSFNDLWTIAGAGAPVGAELGAHAAISFDHFAFGAYGQGTGQVLVTRSGSGDFDPDVDASLTADGAGVAYWAPAVGYGRMVSDTLALGVTVKQIRLKQAVANVSASYDAETATFSTTNVNDATEAGTAVTADVGLLWWPQPEIYDRQLRIGVVVRNVTSPDISIPLAGSPITTISFEPTVNVGVARSWGHGETTVAAELRNALASNGGSGFLCVGLERRHWPFDWIDVRAGLYRGDLMGGATVNLGPVSLTFGTNSFDETIGLSANVRF